VVPLALWTPAATPADSRAHWGAMPHSDTDPAGPDEAAGLGVVDAAFRLEVGRLRARDQRRTFPTELRIGRPAGPQVSLEVPPADAGLGLDLTCALLDVWREQHGGPAFAWTVRAGVPTPHDLDLAWYAAAVRGFGAAGEALQGFRAVTKTGWLDVVTGESRVWKRLRLDRG
jgi:hypothetical protein